MLFRLGPPKANQDIDFKRYGSVIYFLKSLLFKELGREKLSGSYRRRRATRNRCPNQSGLNGVGGLVPRAVLRYTTPDICLLLASTGL